MKPRVDSDLAVALEYEKGSRDAPRVTAKGTGTVAQKIIEVAEEHGIAVESNPILAEALSGVELDEEIPIELYEAVAEVIAFVLRAQGRAGRSTQRQR